MSTLTVLDLVRAGLGGAVIAVALAIMAGGVLGMLRFPDFYTRLHALRAGETAGAVLFLFGLAILADDGRTALLLLLLAALIGAMGPTLAQLQANAAHSAGLAPLAGRYVAPRPGVKRGTPR